MGLRDALKRVLGDRVQQPTAGGGLETSTELLPDFDSFGVNFRTDPQNWSELTSRGGSGKGLEQYTVLALLEEQGDAAAIPNGFKISARDLARLDPEIFDLLGLPDRFPGTLQTSVHGNTTSSHFKIMPTLKIDGMTVSVDRHGAVVNVGMNEYVLSPMELAALEAIEAHEALSPSERTEASNVALVAKLQEAKAASTSDSAQQSLEIDLAHLEKFQTSVPDKVGVIVTPQADGSLELSPDLGDGISDIDVVARERQLEKSDVLRIDERLVLLHERQKAGVKEIRRNHRIPANKRDDFLKAPGEVLDPSLVDLDISFSVRVEGIGAIVPMSFAEAQKTGIDWLTAASTILAPEALVGLVHSEPELDDVKEKIDTARRREQPTITYDQKIIDVSSAEKTDEAIAYVERTIAGQSEAETKDTESDDGVQIGMYIAESRDRSDQLRRLADRAATSYAPDLSGLKFTPFPHQTDGIAWAAGMMAASLDADGEESQIQGALLADDMGLGKTFMTLVALRDFADLQRRTLGDAKPILAVLPLSLIENWEDELRNAFEVVPFKDVKVLQASRDQNEFRIRGRGAESKASADALDNEGMVKHDSLHLSLRVGATQKERRLDMPGRLVLTTYESLARYQLSLGQVEWGAVVFDEAQRIKNPEVLTSRAAKGLKADFKLLCTGTPVENSLKDIWNLLDTAQPDLMGSWSDFREQWVKSAEDESVEQQQERGRKLRDQIGRFMLRRTKEDKIEGLPSKTVHTGLARDTAGPVQGHESVYDSRLSIEMPEIQRVTYDHVLEVHRPRRGGALETIQRLRSVSLHPAVLAGSGASWDISNSARAEGMLKVLDGIRDANEKAIIFVISKAVQAKLAGWLHERYGFSPRIVNGETKAVASSSAKAGETRKAIIGEFEAKDGFNLIIMSPLAVGVGLTVVGANHAIHLERHWNPAKEAQATDRIYRIGQTRPVHVYLPLATHPSLKSFDVNLDALLQSKTDLKDSVVVPGNVENEMMARMGISDIKR